MAADEIWAVYLIQLGKRGTKKGSYLFTSDEEQTKLGSYLIWFVAYIFTLGSYLLSSDKEEIQIGSYLFTLGKHRTKIHKEEIIRVHLR